MFGDYLNLLAYALYALYALLLLAVGVALLSVALAAHWWAGLIPGPLIVQFVPVLGDMHALDRLLVSLIVFAVGGLTVWPVAAFGTVPDSGELSGAARWVSIVIGVIATAWGIALFMAHRHQ